VNAVRRIAERLGFSGQIEYRHVQSQSGGAQFCLGPTVGEDLLAVYAEAFTRDADPQDFSLLAIIAHECSHQRLLRNRALREILKRFPNERFEEVLASLVGAQLLHETKDSTALVWKATADLAMLGMPADETVRLIEQLQGLIARFL
jgi:hypothetical protein